MATPDMDVIKEIPGYKVILKAILKTQIQQLVEQLASTTDEESVILTASVTDGTLCHLGSDSGKSFLEDHEDIKSQFLGFCLKRHHRRKQVEKEKPPPQTMARGPPIIPTHLGTGPGPRLNYNQNRSPRIPYPRQLMPRHQMSPGGHIRSPAMRHEPYPALRPMRRISQESASDPGGNLNQFPMMLPNQMPLSGRIDNQVIKIEASESTENSNNSHDDLAPSLQLPISSQSSPSRATLAADNDDKSNSSTSTIPNEPTDVKFSAEVGDGGHAEFGLNSDGSGGNSNPTSVHDSKNNLPKTSSSADIDPDVNVKIEAITESEMELEITGVEPGRMPNMGSGSQDNWEPDGQGEMFDPSGAMGNPDDMQGYNDAEKKDNKPANSDDVSGEIGEPNNPDKQVKGGSNLSSLETIDKHEKRATEKSQHSLSTTESDHLTREKSLSPVRTGEIQETDSKPGIDASSENKELAYTEKTNDTKPNEGNRNREKLEGGNIIETCIETVETKTLEYEETEYDNVTHGENRENDLYSNRDEARTGTYSPLPENISDPLNLVQNEPCDNSNIKKTYVKSKHKEIKVNDDSQLLEKTDALTGEKQSSSPCDYTGNSDDENMDVEVEDNNEYNVNSDGNYLNEHILKECFEMVQELTDTVVANLDDIATDEAMPQLSPEPIMGIDTSEFEQQDTNEKVYKSEYKTKSSFSFDNIVDDVSVSGTKLDHLASQTGRDRPQEQDNTVMSEDEAYNDPKIKRILANIGQVDEPNSDSNSNDKAYQVLAIWNEISDSGNEASSEVLYDLITQKLKETKARNLKGVIKPQTMTSDCVQTEPVDGSSVIDKTHDSSVKLDERLSESNMAIDQGFVSISGTKTDDENIDKNCIPKDDNKSLEENLSGNEITADATNTLIDVESKTCFESEKRRRNSETQTECDKRISTDEPAVYPDTSAAKATYSNAADPLNAAASSELVSMTEADVKLRSWQSVLAWNEAVNTVALSTPQEKDLDDNVNYETVKALDAQRSSKEAAEIQVQSLNMRQKESVNMNKPAPLVSTPNNTVNTPPMKPSQNIPKNISPEAILIDEGPSVKKVVPVNINQNKDITHTDVGPNDAQPQGNNRVTANIQNVMPSMPSNVSQNVKVTQSANQAVTQIKYSTPVKHITNNPLTSDSQRGQALSQTNPSASIVNRGDKTPSKQTPSKQTQAQPFSSSGVPIQSPGFRHPGVQSPQHIQPTRQAVPAKALSTPTGTQKICKKPTAATPTKQTFIDSLIAKGVPIIIPDDDDDENMPGERSPAFKMKSKLYYKEAEQRSPVLPAQLPERTFGSRHDYLYSQQVQQVQHPDKSTDFRQDYNDGRQHVPPPEREYGIQKEYTVGRQPVPSSEREYGIQKEYNVGRQPVPPHEREYGQKEYTVGRQLVPPHEREYASQKECNVGRQHVPAPEREYGSQDEYGFGQQFQSQDRDYVKQQDYVYSQIAHHNYPFTPPKNVSIPPRNVMSPPGPSATSPRSRNPSPRNVTFSPGHLSAQAAGNKKASPRNVAKSPRNLSYPSSNLPASSRNISHTSTQVLPPQSKSPKVHSSHPNSDRNIPPTPPRPSANFSRNDVQVPRLSLPVQLPKSKNTTTISGAMIVIDDDTPATRSATNINPNSQLVHQLQKASAETTLQRNIQQQHLPVISNVTSMATKKSQAAEFYGSQPNAPTGMLLPNYPVTPRKMSQTLSNTSMEIQRANERTPVKRSLSGDEIPWSSTGLTINEPEAKRRNTYDGEINNAFTLRDVLELPASVAMQSPRISALQSTHVVTMSSSPALKMSSPPVLAMQSPPVVTMVSPPSQSSSTLSQNELSPSKRRPEVFIDIDVDETDGKDLVAKTVTLRSLGMIPVAIDGSAASPNTAYDSSTSESENVTPHPPAMSADSSMSPPPINPTTPRAKGGKGGKGVKGGKGPRGARSAATLQKLSCEECGKECNSKAALKSHMKTHSDDKPFGCDVCGKKFTQKCNLKKHIYTHFKDQDK